MQDNVIFIGFADNKIPRERETRSNDYIEFGERNAFPNHILYLYNKSSSHGAIVNGKVTYILGQGFPGNPVVNRFGETLNQVFRKFAIDIELFGGGRIEVIWKTGGGAELVHMPFQKLRVDKSRNGYWYRKDWTGSRRDDEAKFIPAFDINKKQGAQIFAYNEYRPGCDYYPLPNYFSGLNDIETDTEISIYYLSVMKNGQFSGKIVTFFDGVPTEEEKKKLERRWNEKFNGSGNAGKTMLAFANNNSKEPVISDLSTTDLDKLFDQLAKSTQSKIFTGHQVTSPMLFGVKTEGQLGGRSEFLEAYEIFKNTYINAKQLAIEEVLNVLAPLVGAPAGQKIVPVEPLSLSITPTDFKELIPKEWVYEKLGIDPSKFPSIAGDNVSGVSANDNMKNLSGRQYQQVLRIIRQYSQGKIDKNVAMTMLRTGYGLSDGDINMMLGIDEGFSAEYTEEEVAAMFVACGRARSEFTIVKRRETFDKTEAEEFADISKTDSNILDLMKKDKRITPQVIAQTIKESVAYVESRIKSLVERGVITPKQTTIGVDTIIEHAINTETIDTRPPASTVDVYIKYSYEPLPGLKPIIETTRPFCKRLIELDRLYTRQEIESISQRVGYSVWDRRGGFWGKEEHCRHRWVRNVVIKKR